MKTGCWSVKKYNDIHNDNCTSVAELTTKNALAICFPIVSEQNLNPTLDAICPKPSKRVFANAKKISQALLTSNSNSNIMNVDNEVDVNIEKYDATTRQDYDNKVLLLSPS